MSKPWFAIVDDTPLPVAATPKGRAAWSEEQKRAVSAARGWNDDSVGRLRTMWKDGETCAAIATALSREFDYPYTRNAVIGKVSRLGLSGRIKPQAQGPKPKSAPKPAPDRTKLKSDGTVAPYFASTPLPAEPPVVPFAEPCTLFDLRERMCRWPIGDPREESFRFCGARTDRDGVPYCVGHTRMAYQPMQDRRRDRGLARLVADHLPKAQAIKRGAIA